MRKKQIGLNLYFIIFSAIIVIAMLIPFIYLVSGSLKSDSAFIQEPLKIIPTEIVFTNYQKLFEAIPFARQFMNSMFVGVTSTVSTVIACSLVAYGFSRYEFKGKKVLFSVMLATMFIPAQALTVPHFIMFRDFGWINTYWPMILPSMTSVFFIYLLTQLMRGIPKELTESAIIDGCGDLKVFIHIYMPLIKSGIGITTVMRFMGSWNDFMTPLIYINQTDLQTLPVGLQSLKSFQSTAYGTTMAGAVIASIPIIILLLVVGKKYFVSGLMAGGIKG